MRPLPHSNGSKSNTRQKRIRRTHLTSFTAKYNTHCNGSSAAKENRTANDHKQKSHQQYDRNKKEDPANSGKKTAQKNTGEIKQPLNKHK